MSLIVILLSVFGAVYFAIIAVFSKNQAKETKVRISRALGQREISVEEDTGTLTDRVLRPVLHRFSHRLSVIAPNRQKEQIAIKLSAAGMSDLWEEVEWNSFQYVLSIFVGLSTLGIASLITSSLIVRLEISLMGLIIGYFIPNYWLKIKAQQRQSEIEKTLPDILDLLTVSVEAGLGFDAALLKVVEKKKGVLAEEFLGLLQEIKMGRPRRETLRDLARRNKHAEDLGNVIASLVQADQLGISIGGVLRNQAAQIRQKQRQRIEEKAQKAPIKMMIPLVFFIFPTIFIIVIGPAIIQIINVLK